MATPRTRPAVVDETTPAEAVAADPAYLAAVAAAEAAPPPSASVVGSAVERAIADGDVDALAAIARAAEALIAAGVISTSETQLAAAVTLGRLVRGEPAGV